jgi:demethylmenaquinone methyltransferase/2-methoxy-6-polyprenyl-1,4-benzoquinol methylase
VKAILPNTGDKPEFVRRGFESIADRYDLLNDMMTLGWHRRWKREAVEKLRLQEGMTLLDLCAGTGDLAYRAARRIGERGRVVALDFAPAMMNAGRKRASVEFRRRVFWTAGDAGALPFAADVFDGAVIGFGLRNVVSLETTLREVRRVLKPAAFLVSLDTAGTEWKALMPIYRWYMARIVPRLGKILAGSEEMYGYLSASATAFHDPKTLCSLFQQCGFRETGYAYRPRLLGGAALVWGRKGET